MPDTGNHELVRLFEELRRADASATPPFGLVLERARRGNLRAPSALLRAGAAAVLTAALLLAGLLLRTALRNPRREDQPTSLAQWTSPTDSLLRTPGSELLEEPRALLEWPPDYAHFERSSPRPAHPTVRPLQSRSRSKGERP